MSLDKQRVSVYLTKDEKNWLQTLADRNSRSLSNQIRVMLMDVQKRQENTNGNR